MIAIIGDIHGCYYTLLALYRKIKTKYNDIDIYSVGDLVDRGLYSINVVDFVISNGINAIKGNHEMMFYDYFKDHNTGNSFSWLFNGSTATINNYEGNKDILEEHLDFIHKLPLYYNLEHCFISHAGISSFYKNIFTPDVFYDEAALNGLIENTFNENDGILWNRNRLLAIDKLQVVGHTMKKNVVYNKLNNSLYIDTSVYLGNKLSAVFIDGNEYIGSVSVPSDERDIK